MVFFSKVSFQKYLMTTMFKVLYQQLRSTLTTTFERHLTTEDFMDIGAKPALRHLTYYCMLFFLSNKPSFKFNLMLIEQFLPQFIYLSIFWYCILKFIQYLYAFFVRASKFSWAWMLFFLWRFTATKYYYIFIFHETLVPVNDKNCWH